MASSVILVFLVIIMSVEKVYSRNCSKLEDLLNCNECIRCGGNWCNNPIMGTAQCAKEYDGWCSGDRERTATREITEPGSSDRVSPLYVERTAAVGAPNTVTVTYRSTREQLTNLTLVHATPGLHKEHLALNFSTKCSGDECLVMVEAYLGHDFCFPNGSTEEYVTAKLKVEDFDEEVILKFHVTCACACEQRVEKHSRACNSRGDLSCGVCSCYDEWKGPTCDIDNCQHRGDIQVDYCRSSMHDSSSMECSGNGYCKCDFCECFNDLPGAMFFDDKCTDLCSATCETCLRNPDLNIACSDCSDQFDVHFKPLDYNKIKEYNKTIETQTYEIDGQSWIQCNKTLSDSSYIEFLVTKTEIKTVRKEETIVTVMLLPYQAERVTVSGTRITAPIIIGLLGCLAATAVAAAYIAYKKRLPPLPLHENEYKNIAAQESTGENPLYKPPTTSFKNPTYGKWL